MFPSRATLAVLALAILFVRGAAAHAEGALAARGPDGQDLGLFPLVRTEVRAEVSGQVTSVSVTQRYHNAFRDRIEAVYVFPLPDDAAVDRMEMHLGARTVRATIDRRDAARRRYDAARDQGRRAALLEQERPNVFTFAVANIDPGADVAVELHYFALARYDHATYEMVFPMVVGPRYIPGDPLPGPPSGTGTHPDTDRVTDASRISPAYMPPGTRSGHAVALTVHLDAGAEIQTVEAPAHDVVVARPTPGTADVALRDKDEIPNRDFILRWRLAAPELRTAVLAHRPDPHGDGYVSLQLEPRHDAPDGEIAPREIVFLLDTSGSMSGPPLAAVKAAIRQALGSLGAADTFQVIDFADAASAFAPRPLANTPANVRRATDYLDHLEASGGTNQLAGIHAALAAPGDPMRLRYVVFMTDGYIGNEAEVIALTHREIGAARIFSFGVGASVNRYLLDEVALAGRGAAEYLRPDEDPGALVDRFYQRVGRPYLTDVEIDWGSLAVQDVEPAPLPDLSALEPLTVLGRYRAPGSGTVTVRGRVAGRPFERRVAVELPAQEPAHAALASVWARQRVAALSRAEHLDGATAASTEAITALALAHHLVSQYTSLVAIDDAPAAGPPGTPRRVVQPAEAPEGVDLQSAGGSLVGAGWGGGGTGEGTIGFGALGTMGHGAGAGYGAGAGRGLANRATSLPAVRAAQPLVAGTLSPEVIRRVVLRNLGQITRCYEAGLAADPTAAGRVVLRFVIGPTGAVLAVAVTEAPPAAAGVARCVARVLHGWQFPAPAGGTVTVSYPFNLTPPETPTPAPTPRRRARP